jgi:glycosyl transferase family 2
MLRSPGIVANIIVGAKPEPYLAASLEAIADVCDHAVINDNSGLREPANAAVYSRSRLAAAGRLTIIRTTFENFSVARNACLDAIPRTFEGGWILFVDADEVHGGELPAMANLLERLPGDIDAVDGYSRHYWGSFGWWVAIDRRLCFFRHTPRARWSGAVHERLVGADRRAVVPAVWAHYGHVVTPRMEWEKSRLYASLGQCDWAPDDSDLVAATPAEVYGERARRAMPHRGAHSVYAASAIATLSREWSSNFREMDRLVALQTPADRARNALRSMNYSRLLGWRSAEARFRWRWDGRIDAAHSHAV